MELLGLALELHLGPHSPASRSEKQDTAPEPLPEDPHNIPKIPENPKRALKTQRAEPRPAACRLCHEPPDHFNGCLGVSGLEYESTCCFNPFC